MERLEVSGAVRPIYGSLGVKRLSISTVTEIVNSARPCEEGKVIEIKPCNDFKEGPFLLVFWRMHLLNALQKCTSVEEPAFAKSTRSY